MTPRPPTRRARAVTSPVFPTALALLAALALPAAARAQEKEGAAEPRSDQEEAGGRIVDHGYLFELQRPGHNWKLMPEAEVNRVIPGAKAGALEMEAQGQRCLAVLVAEAAGGDEVEEARLVSSMLNMEDASFGPIEKAEIEGRPGARFTATGKLNDSHFLFAITLIRRGDYTYYILAWTAGNTVASLQALERRVRLTDGDRIRPRVFRRPDEVGVGWRVEEGVFESACFGLRAAPPGPKWRLSVGIELRAVSADSEVALIRAQPEVFLTVIAERASGVDQEKFAEHIRAQHAAALGAGEPVAAFETKLGGSAVKLSVSPSGIAAGVDTVHGVFFRGELAIQVVGSLSARNRADAQKLIEEGLAGFSFLDEARRAEVTAAIEAGKDTQNQVGPSYAVRGGVYRNYDHGITWTSPPGFWVLDAGQNARTQNPDACLFAHERTLGLYAMVIAERAPGFSSERYHRVVLGNMVGPGHPALAAEPEVEKRGGVEVRASTFDADLGAIQLTYRLATFVEGDRLVQLMIWSVPKSFEAASDLVEKMVDGLVLSEGALPEKQSTPARFRDDRLGFTVALPAKEQTAWRLRDETPPELRSLASLVRGLPSAPGGPERGFGVLALCASEPGQDETFLEQLAEQAMMEMVSREIPNLRPLEQVKKGTLSGLPCRIRRLEEKGGPGFMQLHIARRDRTVIMVIAFDRSGHMIDPNEIAGWVELVDWDRAKRDAGRPGRFY